MGLRTTKGCAVVAALLLAGPACGGASPEFRSESEAAPRTLRTTIYLLADNGAAPVGVRRTINRRSPFAREAILALLAGPSAAERRRGLVTALPTRTGLLSLTFKGRDATTAVVDLSGLPPARGRPREAATLGMRVRILTQLARTLIGTSGIERIQLRVGGTPWDLWTMDGGIARTTTDYGRLLGWTRICGDRSPAERERGLTRCFSAVP
jgi:hypothetical protein